MLAIGIVGLPNIGKSTLFNSLTNSNILIANYPFATIEPNVGIVPVPDKRLKKLAEIYNTDKIVPATVKFTDIAGLVRGASEGEGLGNQFLSNIRSCNAILHVVRAFDDGNVIHVSNSIDPKDDIETIQTELMLADISTLDKHIPKLLKDAKANPKIKVKIEALEKLKDSLNNGVYYNDIEEDLLDGLQLLTKKPVIYVFNIDEKDINNNELKNKLSGLVPEGSALFVCAKLENEINSFSEEEKEEFLQGYNLKESGLDQLIKKAYSLLKLQSFLTAGVKEVRAWTINQGSTAPEAAGVIHGDFEKGFIAAEIVSYQDLVECGSLQKARQLGKIRTEGKTYIMQPNDVVEFRFNVTNR